MTFSNLGYLEITKSGSSNEMEGVLGVEGVIGMVGVTIVGTGPGVIEVEGVIGMVSVIGACPGVMGAVIDFFGGVFVSGNNG